MNIIRKAKPNDIDAVALIFEHIIEEEEKCKCTIGWQRDVYPTRNTAVAALERDDLFVMEEGKTKNP